MPLPVELDPRAEEEARAAFLWYLERSERAAAAFEREMNARSSGSARIRSSRVFALNTATALEDLRQRHLVALHYHAKYSYWLNIGRWIISFDRCFRARGA